jgi:hypothetical protein
LRVTLTAETDASGGNQPTGNPGVSKGTAAELSSKNLKGPNGLRDRRKVEMRDRMGQGASGALKTLKKSIDTPWQA